MGSSAGVNCFICASINELCALKSGTLQPPDLGLLGKEQLWWWHTGVLGLRKGKGHFQALQNQRGEVGHHHDELVLAVSAR